MMPTPTSRPSSALPEGLALNFLSDNAAGASPAVMNALARSHEGFQAPYGGDEYTARVEQRLADVFEREVSVLLVPTGTAANALSLATLVSPWQGVLCHHDAHIHNDECGAPEFFSGGAKLIGLGGPGGRLDLQALEAEAGRKSGDLHAVQPHAVSVTQATEYGEVYTVPEIAAIGEACRRHGLRLHMDGARFANALVSLGCTPAEMTWKAGVDALSFGATKNGVLGAEAIVLFDRDRTLGHEAALRRKRAGHLFSKMRFLAVQMEAYLTDDLWLKNARHANAMTKRLLQGLDGVAGVEVIGAPRANIVFCRLPDAMIDALKADGVGFVPHRWGRGVVRFVTSFVTQPEAVDWLTARIAALAAANAA